ncbi:MAG: WG repeat-containing protein [Candidatus Sulfotelmatobacter sp.]
MSIARPVTLAQDVNGIGQLVINPQFDYAEEFHEGRALVCLGKPCDWWESPRDTLWGFIDTSGKVVVTPQYPSASAFSEGLASVCTGDCSSKPTKPHSRGYIDRDGKLVIPMQFGVAGGFSESLAQVCVGTCEWVENSGYNGKWGFIDHSGRFVINPQYDNVLDFKNGYAKVFVGKGTDAKTGYIDKTGKTIWQPSN